MSFAEYLRQWMSSQEPIFEASKPNKNSGKNNSDEVFNEIKALIDTGFGGDPSNDNDRNTSFESLRQALEKTDVSLLEKIKSTPELQSALLGLINPEKMGMVEEFVKRSKKAMSNISSEKKKVGGPNPFKKFISLKTRESVIINQAYKLYQVFSYAADQPDYDAETALFVSIKSKGLELIAGDKTYTIKNIGGVDNSVKSDEVTLKDAAGEEITMSKYNFKRIVDANPEVKENAQANATESYRKKVERVKQKIEDLIQKEIASSIKDDEERIEAIPNTPDGAYQLNIDWKPLIDALGYTNIYKKAIDKKEEEIKKVEKPSLRRKNIIKNNLINALNSALLPPIVDGEVSPPGGDYFKLFKTLYAKNTAWMEKVLLDVLKSPERISQFKTGPMVKESALEEDQLAYLELSKEWIAIYINSEVEGELADRDRTSALSKIEGIFLEKQKQIKNSYLSRDFNMGNFKGLQLKPQLRLPLYVKVQLAVSEKDKVKESPLKNLLIGTGQLVAGLFASIPDTGKAEIAAANAKQNAAIFTGLTSIIKAGVIAIGGKQAGRDMERGVKKFTTATGLDNLGIERNTEHGYFKHLEIPKHATTVDGGVKSSKSNESEGVMSPGTSFQTPDTMVSPNMDTLSLAGPGKSLKKSGKSNKKKKKPTLGTKVSNFNDFLKQRD